MKIIKNHRSPGPSGSRNCGSEIARGKYLIFIDSDVEVEIDGIQKIYDSITVEGIDAVYGLYSKDYPYKNKNFLGEYKNLYWYFKLV